MSNTFHKVIEGRVRILRHNVNDNRYQCSLRYWDLLRNEKYIEFYSNTRIEAKSGDYFRLEVEKENNIEKVSFYNSTIGLYQNSEFCQENIIGTIISAIFLLVISFCSLYTILCL